MKVYFFILVLIFSFGCQYENQNTLQEEKASSFFVGTYNSDTSKGIYSYQLNHDGQMKRLGLAAVSDNPSFLAMSADKRFLVTTNENNIEGTGTVESFLIQGDSLIFISRSSSGGGHPCYISVNENGFVLVANYTGGNVGLLRLNDVGDLTALLDMQQHSGNGTTDRQTSPHAHSTRFNPDDNSIISADLGTNELWFSHIDTGHQRLLPSNPNKLRMNPGAGPRHLTFHPNGKWIYVVNELDCTVSLIEKNDQQGGYKLGKSVSTLPDDFVEPNTCADIHISQDGRFVYASNRGHNSIAIFEVSPHDGNIKLLGHQSTYGEWPRNFTLSPNENYVLVANQYTHNIVSFKRNKITGLLSYISEIEAPNPVCILF